jgi:hypothetical protein
MNTADDNPGSEHSSWTKIKGWWPIIKWILIVCMILFVIAVGIWWAVEHYAGATPPPTASDVYNKLVGGTNGSSTYAS